jgi:hypothetical protein
MTRKLEVALLIGLQALGVYPNTCFARSRRVSANPTAATRPGDAAGFRQ